MHCINLHSSRLLYEFNLVVKYIKKIMVEKFYIYSQAWLNKMKMIELQNALADKETEINEDDDILNLKVNLSRI